MSFVSEATMQLGDWEIQLSPDTPTSIAVAVTDLKSAIGGATLVVTDHPVTRDEIPGLFTDPVFEADDGPPGTIQVGDPNPLPYDVGPRYSGILIDAETSTAGVTITGTGNEGLLGDGQRGQMIYRRIPFDVGDPPETDGATLFDDAIDGADTYGEEWDFPASSLKRRFYFETDDEQKVFGEDVAGWFARRRLLEMIAVRWGTEWVVRSTGYVDMGTVDQLYPEPPPFITRRGGNDRIATGEDIAGLTAADLTIKSSLADWSNEVVFLAASKPVVISAGSPYRDRWGRPLSMARLVDRSDVSGEAAVDYAYSELGKTFEPRQEITVDSGTHHGLNRVVCGQRVQVWDPAVGLVGDDPVRHRGQWTWPVLTRIVGHRWPIRPGMGVYLYWWISDTEWEVLDLTRWVVHGTDDPQVAVGDAPRPTFPEPTPPQLLADEDALSSEYQGHVGVQQGIAAALARTGEDIPAINFAPPP